MNSKKIFHFFLVLLALGLFASLAIGCNAADTVPMPLPIVTNAPTETLLPILPTSTYTYPTLTPIPTDIPYPTASIVKANAVAFISLEGNGYSLWVANIDGSGERKLADIEDNAERTSNYLLRWSSDGKWISYISGNDLWVISPDGSVRRKEIVISDADKDNIWSYSWSPDSSKIAYIQTTDGKPTTRILDLETEDKSELPVSADQLSLSWSPDGRYILLNTYTSLTIFEVPAGKVLKEINLATSTSDECLIMHGGLTWSPDSKSFYHVDGGTGYYNAWICVGALDGTSWRIKDVGVVISSPVWDKTGKFLYFVVGEMKLDSGPNWCVNQRLVRYDVQTRRLENLLSLEEDGPTAYPRILSLSPDGQMLGLYSYTIREDYKSSLIQNKFIILDIHSLSMVKYSLEHLGETREPLRQPMWSHDNENVIFSDYDSFYSLDIATGKVSLFSGVHAVENAVISPIATPP